LSLQNTGVTDEGAGYLAAYAEDKYNDEIVATR
jgi:hypothetical protein